MTLPQSSPKLPYTQIADAGRADVLDALRGFALLGILISHIPDFSGYSFMSAQHQAALNLFGFDEQLATVQDFLIRGKFYSLFSLLFGIGFAVQLDSAARRGADFTRHFARRLGVLLLIGLAHASIWYGDILKDYAIIGLLLLLTRTWSTRGIVLASAIVLIVRVLWPIGVYVAVASLGLGAATGDAANNFDALARTFAAPQPGALFITNFELVKMKALQMVYDGKTISILGMFLLGAVIGRLAIYRDLARHRKMLFWTLMICAPIGLVGNAALTPIHASTPAFPPTLMWVIESMLFAVAVPAMALAYASAFAIIWLRNRSVLAWLAPAGRMALTTYVSQTIICIAIFYGIGLGLAGKIGQASGTLFGITLFVAQCGLCALWLRRFHFGPIEWLWRTATYGVAMPFVRQS